ncbi:MAG: helix-turn-helix domain-containing protein [Peptococcaceae bacterium]|nr:helix-turn-helix domain-containing protein [Peptococcaceae bacterium]
MTIGERLRFFREQAGISGKYLAERAGLVPSQIYKIESNVTKPSLDSLERICQVLGITLGQFFSDQLAELSPEEHQIFEKVRKLSPEKLKVLNAVLDTWKEDEPKYKPTNEKNKNNNQNNEEGNDADYLCQLLDLKVVVPTIKGRPLTKEETNDLIRYIRNHPNLLPSNEDEDFLLSYVAHDESKSYLKDKPELINIIKASEKINDMLQKYLEKKNR